MPDENGDEVDGQDETLLPLDYETKGAITDDVLLKELVLPLPEGVQLVSQFRYFLQFKTRV